MTSAIRMLTAKQIGPVQDTGDLSQKKLNDSRKSPQKHDICKFLKQMGKHTYDSEGSANSYLTGRMPTQIVVL